ncbi:serine protease [Telmatospirillum siberiense]|uniref:Serine protease n=2 Tax=Telmatospirillum siberiense TaxID=382514 RepID=A0A2N3PWC8_9PROT|nr:serine protease [Telmatospirillum siberiense]
MGSLSKTFRFAVLCVAMMASTGSGARAQSSPGAPPAAEPPSAVAEQIYAEARPKLLQIRTMLTAAGRQASIGSGFLVGDGQAITNYHVVSQYVMEPGTYTLEYVAMDGGRGSLQVIAVDVADDLAVVRLDKDDRPHFDFDPRALARTLPKGERLYSLGNPLDLGFAIIEGTYNGLVERSYGERIHFSASLNPGVSGGPALSTDGRVVGVNVARMVRGEQVSFLVPAIKARTLLAEAVGKPVPAPSALKEDVGRQLTAWQTGFFKAFTELGMREVAFGAYQVPESLAPWFSCWANTNAGENPKPRATVNTSFCNSNSQLFIAPDLSSGMIHMSHSLLRNGDLNDFQFASFLSQLTNLWGTGNQGGKWQSQTTCHDDFLALAGNHPPLRGIWCARAYRPFNGLYDVWMLAITQDGSQQALVSRLALEGTDYDTAISVARHFLEMIQWKK